MLSNRAKLLTGIVALFISGILWWSGENPGGQSPFQGTLSDISWEYFPLISGELSSMGESDAWVVFVYSPHECYPNMEAMQSWHRQAQAVEGLRAVNVLIERGQLSARRYLSVYPTPFPTRLDSTGWFQAHFDLIQTPAVLLLSRDRPAQVIYPAQQTYTAIERMEILKKLDMNKL